MQGEYASDRNSESESPADYWMHNLSESATTDNKQSERMRAMLAAKQYIKKNCWYLSAKIIMSV
jgi:hypothetical protein